VLAHEAPAYYRMLKRFDNHSFALVRKLHDSTSGSKRRIRMLSESAKTYCRETRMSKNIHIPMKTSTGNDQRTIVTPGILLANKNERPRRLTAGEQLYHRETPWLWLEFEVHRQIKQIESRSLMVYFKTKSHARGRITTQKSHP